MRVDERPTPDVILLIDDLEIIDYIHDNIKEPEVRKEIYTLLDKDKETDTIVSIRLTSGIYCLLIKAHTEEDGGLVMLLSPQWQDIIWALGNTLHEGEDGLEVGFIYDVMEQSKLQFLKIEEDDKIQSEEVD